VRGGTEKTSHRALFIWRGASSARCCGTGIAVNNRGNRYQRVMAEHLLPGGVAHLFAWRAMVASFSDGVKCGEMANIGAAHTSQHRIPARLFAQALLRLSRISAAMAASGQQVDGSAVSAASLRAASARSRADSRSDVSSWPICGGRRCVFVVDGILLATTGGMRGVRTFCLPFMSARSLHSVRWRSAWHLKPPVHKSSASRCAYRRGISVWNSVKVEMSDITYGARDKITDKRQSGNARGAPGGRRQRRWRTGVMIAAPWRRWLARIRQLGGMAARLLSVAADAYRQLKRRSSSAAA